MNMMQFVGLLLWFSEDQYFQSPPNAAGILTAATFKDANHSGGMDTHTHIHTQPADSSVARLLGELVYNT